MSRHFGSLNGSGPSATIDLDFFVIVQRPAKTFGARPSVRISAGYPNLGRDERAVQLRLSLPIALYETPTLRADITIAAPEQPVTVDVSTVAAAVAAATGLDFHITVQGPDQ